MRWIFTCLCMSDIFLIHTTHAQDLSKTGGNTVVSNTKFKLLTFEFAKLFNKKVEIIEVIAVFLLCVYLTLYSVLKTYYIMCYEIKLNFRLLFGAPKLHVETEGKPVQPV